jgi:hypothetical protein
MNKYGECAGCNSVSWGAGLEEFPVGECAVCPPGQKLNPHCANEHKCDKCGSKYEPTGKGPILKHRGNL